MAHVISTGSDDVLNADHQAVLSDYTAPAHLLSLMLHDTARLIT